MSRAYIGTSGFSYPHWGNGIFYPKDLPQRKWFEYYCQHFSTVELNVSFYRLPKKEVFAGWRRRAGPEFVFSIKGSRFITHIKKLKDCQEAVERFFETARGLECGWVVGSESGCGDENGKKKKNPTLTTHPRPTTHNPSPSSNVILWQLPPGWRVDCLRLESFLKILPQTFRHAFEFRNQTWLAGEIYQVLRKYNAAVVFQDYPDWPITKEVIADFIYIRLHGNRELYSSEYTEDELKEWAKRIKKHLKEGRDAYVYFNNDAQNYAVPNALTLKKLLG